MSDDTIWQIAGLATSNALSDNIWQLFGFAGRPKHGTIFDWFRPRWRVDLETKLVREMTVAPIAVHVVAGAISMRQVEEIVAIFAGQSELYECFGYKTQDAAIEGLYTSIREYSETPVDQWGKLLLTRLEAFAIPDRRMAAGIVGGSVKFSLLTEDVLRDLLM